MRERFIRVLDYDIDLEKVVSIRHRLPSLIADPGRENMDLWVTTVYFDGGATISICRQLYFNDRCVTYERQRYIDEIERLTAEWKIFHDPATYAVVPYAAIGGSSNADGKDSTDR